VKLFVIYDDTGKKSEAITDIIGDKGFGDVVVKKRHLEDYYRDTVKEIYQDAVWKKIRSVFEYAELIKELDLYVRSDVRIMHCLANYLISDAGKASLSFRKLVYVDEPYGVTDGGRAVAAMFPDVESYIGFCKNALAGLKPWDMIRSMKNTIEIEGVTDIGINENFIQCITGNFDSRYFNTLKGDMYTLVKSSSNKQKIKAEYNFYHFLPDDMKFWFVMPFNYREEGTTASYTMERFHMTDLSVKWVHGSMNEKDFENLMEKYFYFFRCRHRKACSEEVFERTANALYVDKVRGRIVELKRLPGFQKIDHLLNISQDMHLDAIVDRYLALKEKIESKNVYPRELVIGHGDPCFANALYNKPTQTLKLIDPKGALNEEEMWTNAYYDIAKLSHSVCGRYDFFNNALFDIKIGETFSYDLEIEFDNKKYVEIFRKKVEESGFDYLTVRIYEVSLFLSMLPLHIDNPHKVFGFILNAVNILKEIEEYV